jgi:hypothetical protein
MFFTAENNLTELCRIMTKHGSDKGGYSGIGKHNYTPLYNQLFSNIRNSVQHFFEFGIGSTREDIAHTMGQNGKPGASLKGWREYFPNANIYAADIDQNILQPEHRISKFFCDQTCPKSIDNLWLNAELSKIKFDIILEDGYHIFDAQYLFMKRSLNKLKDNGIYICEDVPDKDFPLWATALRNLAQEYPCKSFELIKIDNPKNEWNSIIVIKNL